MTVTLDTYKDIRQRFIELSGRYDLVKGDWQDNGADIFLNEGQKILDRLVTVPGAKATNISMLAANGFYVRCQRLRSVLNVFAIDSSGGKIRLDKKDLADLQEFYGKEYTAITPGTPAYYAPTSFRPNPDTLLSSTVTSMGVRDYQDLMLGCTHFSYSGIILLPPADAAYTIRILGLFYSPALSATLSSGTWTQTESWWSVNHPMTLIQAGLYALESFYRNSEGMKDAMNAITVTTNQIDFDVVEEEISEVDQMEG